MTKRLSESTMHRLWRKAVLVNHSHRCAFCGMPGDENLECHHIVKRRKLLTRWDWKNGIALCHDCHKIAHTAAGAYKIGLKHPHFRYLTEMENLISKDVFVRMETNVTEWYLKQAEEMREIIKAEDF